MTDSAQSYYKYCIVPLCTNTTANCRDKIFFSVPKDPSIRKTWTNAMKRDDKLNPKLSSKSSLWCCEDHFSLEKDMENFCEWKLTKKVKQFKLKTGVVPHHFECQNRMGVVIERKAAKKRKHLSIIEEALSTPVAPTSTCHLPDESLEQNLEQNNFVDKSVQVDLKKNIQK